MPVKAALALRPHRVRWEPCGSDEGSPMVRVVFQEEVVAAPDAGAEGDEMVCLLDLGLPCNMRCDGCGGRRDPLVLSDDAAKGLAQAIAAAARARGAARLSLALYGGEPLLDAERVITLSSRVRRACERSGISYRAHLLTNGTLLGEVPPRHFAAAGFGLVQVTLDGGRRTHDARRRFADGRGSWRSIVEGLKRVRDAASVVVRAPVQHLAPDVEELLAELEHEGLLRGERPVSVYVAKPAPYPAQARELVKLSALLASAHHGAARC